MANPNPDMTGIKDTNLKNRTPEERKEIARKGAEATNRIIKERKTFSELFKAVLGDKIKLSDGTILTRQEAIAIAQINKALKGDNNAFKNIRDTIGEKPIDRVQFTPTNENLKEVEDLLNESI